MSERIELKSSYRHGAKLGDKHGEHRTYTVDVSFDGAPARLLVRVIADADNRVAAVRALRLKGPDGEPLATVDEVYMEDQEMGGAPK